MSIHTDGCRHTAGILRSKTENTGLGHVQSLSPAKIIGQSLNNCRSIKNTSTGRQPHNQFSIMEIASYPRQKRVTKENMN